MSVDELLNLPPLTPEGCERVFAPNEEDRRERAAGEFAANSVRRHFQTLRAEGKPFAPFPLLLALCLSALASVTAAEPADTRDTFLKLLDRPRVELAAEAKLPTDEFGLHAVEDRLHVHDLHATILHLLGINHEQLVFSYKGRPERATMNEGEIYRKITG